MGIVVAFLALVVLMTPQSSIPLGKGLNDLPNTVQGNASVPSDTDQ